MGASYSITGGPAKFILPEELVVVILSNLAVSHLVSCRRVNRRLNSIIDGSDQLQHLIDAAVAGVMDNPNSPLSLIERKEALARRREAWDTLQPQRTTTARIGEIIGMESKQLCSDGTWVHLDPLREGKHVVMQLAACPNNSELVAVGLGCGDVAIFGHATSGTQSLEVDILSFSGDDGEHPWNRKSTVHVKDVLKADGVSWGMTIEIHMNLLAVLLTPTSIRGGDRWPDRELRIFYWKTGEEIACLKGQNVKAFRFLSNSIMVIASVSPFESTAILELFRLPVTNGTGRSTHMIKVAALGLPSVDDGCRIARVDFYPPGAKNLVISRSRLLYNASINTMPFVNPKSDNIIFAYLNIGGGYGYDNISFVVHHSTLLRHVPPSHSLDNVQAPVPWELWGPAATRWYEGGVRVGGQVTCGLRCVLSLGWELWELWDFNPYRVRHLEKDFTVENESARLTVETGPSCARSKGIKNGIYSSLPFVKVVPKKWPGYIFVGLYEDRIIGELPGRGRDGLCLVENLYFG